MIDWDSVFQWYKMVSLQCCLSCINKNVAAVCKEVLSDLRKKNITVSVELSHGLSFGTMGKRQINNTRSFTIL
jgi:hypothetical protein